MCPYYYESYVPEMEIDGYEPEGTDIEILATNSSMPYIEGFWDDYGTHCNVETYYYGVLWGESQYITVIFDPNGVTWRDPLPVGVDDIAGSTGEVKSPQVIDVAIIKERLGEAFDITATYMNRFGGVEQANIGMFTNLCYVNAESPLALSVHNTTSYLGQLTFETNDVEKVVRLRGGESETLNYDLQNTNDGVFNIRIK